MSSGRADPQILQVLCEQGAALHRVGRLEEAAVQYDKVLKRNPGHFDALHLLGLVRLHTGRPEEAVALFARAVKANAKVPVAQDNLGSALVGLGRPAEALASLDAAIALAPGHARAQHNRGTALEALGRSDEAVASYDRAIALKPDYAEAFSNRGLALRNLQRLDEALASYDAAVALDAAYVDAHLGRSFLSLLAGDFEAGWREYEWRKAGRDAAGRPDPDRDWLGEGELAGQRLLVRHEQGLGDTLQFARYVPLLSARGAEVTLVVQPPLAGLLAASLPGVRVIAEGDPAPDADRHVSLMSLPLAFSTTLDTVPPPLRLDADARRADWAERLGAKTRPRIGLAWSGNPAHVNDRNRSIGFSTLAPLLGDAVEWIVLQNDIRPADAEAFAASGRARFFGEALADFADTAALADQLDLIITVDTSLAHLAGGLGKPVWVLLPYSPDWRWLLGRADSPWYPTARLFRQAKAGDWAGVIGEVGEELSRADFK